MTSVRTEIDASVIYVALKAISSVLDEVTLSFSSEGLAVRALDMAEVSMIDLSLPRSLFESYTVNDGDVHKVTVRMSDLVGGGYSKKSGPFKRPKKGDMVLLEHDGGNKLSFTMRGTNFTQQGRTNLTLSVPVFQGDAKDLPLPKVQLTEKFTARTDAIASFLSSARSCSETVWLLPRLDGSMELLVKGEVTEMSVVLSMQEGTLTESELHEVKSALRIEKILKLVQKTFGELTKVEYGKDLPVRISYPLSTGNIFSSAGEIVFFIAPLSEYDDPRPAEKKEPTVTAKEVGEAMAGEAMAAIRQGIETVEPKVEEIEPVKEMLEQEKILEPLRPLMGDAEDVLIAKYGFEARRGLETYSVKEIRDLAEKNVWTVEFLGALRRAIDLHKQFYAAKNGQETFAPVRGDESSIKIDRIDRVMRYAEPRSTEPQIVEQPKPVVQEAPDPLAAFKQKFRKPSPS